MFIRNAWYMAAWASEVLQQPLGRRICGDPVVLFRDRSGAVAALEDRCCHRSAPLSLGSVVDQGLQCGYHGLIFEKGGRCVHVPGQDHVPQKACVKSYPIVEKDEIVWIWMGDPAKADVGKIIDYPWNNDHKNWPYQKATYPVQGNYMLMVDNLMDLTHVGFVHQKTIGGTPASHVDAKMTVTRTEQGLKFVRWMLNSVPPPTYVKAVGFKGNVDRWQEFEFIAPGFVLVWTGAVDAGTGAYDQNKREGGFALRSLHALTPETETSCHYFWSAANGYRQDDPLTTEQLFSELAAAFLEDKVMVEAQQSRLLELGADRLVDIASDSARVHMRRTVDRLIEQERV
jgi:phenylpropionate dioxygenase-like ring-hydroxylating dioxygenase large terminal subunit